MEILPLDASNGMDYIRLRRGCTVGAGVCGVCHGGEWCYSSYLRSESGRCVMRNDGEKGGRGGGQEMERDDVEIILDDVLISCVATRANTS